MLIRKWLVMTEQLRNPFPLLPFHPATMTVRSGHGTERQMKIYSMNDDFTVHEALNQSLNAYCTL